MHMMSAIGRHHVDVPSSSTTAHTLAGCRRIRLNQVNNFGRSKRIIHSCSHLALKAVVIALVWSTRGIGRLTSASDKGAWTTAKETKQRHLRCYIAHTRLCKKHSAAESRQSPKSALEFC